MEQVKPRLVTAIVRRHLWSAALTLGVMLILLLAAADHMVLRVASYELAREARTIEPFNEESFSSAHRTNRGRGGQLLLDADGNRVGGGGERGRWENREVLRWQAAREVIQHGEMSGITHLPWSNEPVVWAARMVRDPHGTPFILLLWNRQQAVRTATVTTYGGVIVTLLVAFIVGLLLSWREARAMAAGIDKVTESGERMVQGDFAIQLPAQPTRELDDLSRVITGLAGHLAVSLDDLRREQQRLERLEQLQRQFIADASHELRAPLTAMAITLDTWRDGLLRPEEEATALADLQRETTRLKELVTKLLDLSRIDAGREPMTLVPINVGEVVHDVLATLRALPGVPIIAEIPDTLPAVLADRDALYRILHNLLENARRFTTEGEIRVSATREGDGIRLRVSDTGCGIAPDDLPQIWDRFSRSGKARAEGQAGSGLGLAIVRGLVDALGGQITVVSRVGIGTTFTILLPVGEKLSGA